MRTHYCLNQAIGDALLITEENKKVIFGLSYFFRVGFFLVRHIFSELGLFELHILSEHLSMSCVYDHSGNLVRQIRYQSAKRHFDLSCIPLFLNVASTSVV